MARKPGGPGIGHRLKELRLHLGWSQETVAERSGIRRTEISIVEAGRNKGTSVRMRTYLARGFGVPQEILDAYWAGKLGIGDVTARMQGRPTAVSDAAIPATVPAAGRPREATRADYFHVFPNLHLAAHLVARDTGRPEDVTRDAALRAAIAQAGDRDRETLDWVRLINAELAAGRSAIRRSPRSIPNLAMAIRLVAEHRKLDEESVHEAAARWLAREPDAGLTTLELSRELEKELDRPRAKAAPPRRQRAQRAKRG